MFFLDAAGFFSIVSLIAQCGLAWAFVLLFVRIATHLERTSWLRSWVLAFVALATSLSAVLARFLLVRNEPWSDLFAEGSAPTRALYAVYLAGKLLFLWFLLAGTFALRQRRWPPLRWSLLPILATAAVAGAALPTIEWHLLAQAPLFVVTNMLAFVLLRGHRRERHDVGSRVVASTLLIWSVLWVAYAIAVLVVSPSHPQPTPIASQVLRWNSLADLLLQSSLAFGLLTLVLQDAQFTLAATAAERDRLRGVVQRDEKLRALSTLVSGVAHELNNPLTAILGFADELDDEHRDTRRKAAQVVREQAERCRGIVRRLSTVAGSGAVVRTPTALPPLLERVARGFQPSLDRNGVRLQLELDPALPEPELDATAIEQVLVNLIDNALHVAPPGSRILLAAEFCGGAVRFVVEDQGPGVSDAVREQMFEPFFTTKPTGQGSGLGLAIAHSLVRAHRGTIAAENLTPHGARFVVTLPVGTTHRPAAPRPAGAPSTPAIGGRVLVVDDEPLVRGTVARQLAQRGWSVVQAASGAEALPWLSGNEPFAAVVCDVRMPDLSGVELWRRVQETHPEVARRFVFATGDPLSIAAPPGTALSQVPVVGKPFEVAELTAAVERAANADRPSAGATA